jgi:hypothetical protein|tara:strand:+ start:321 stop:776 length:456 start_codon:yes stop_codon:yes gene_type:complete
MSYEIRNDKLLREAYEAGRRQGLNEEVAGQDRPAAPAGGGPAWLNPFYDAPWNWPDGIDPGILTPEVANPGGGDLPFSPTWPVGPWNPDDNEPRDKEGNLVNGHYPGDTRFVYDLEGKLIGFYVWTMGPNPNIPPYGVVLPDIGGWVFHPA